MPALGENPIYDMDYGFSTVLFPVGQASTMYLLLDDVAYLNPGSHGEYIGIRSASQLRSGTQYMLCCYRWEMGKARLIYAVKLHPTGRPPGKLKRIASLLDLLQSGLVYPFSDGDNVNSRDCLTGKMNRIEWDDISAKRVYVQYTSLPIVSELLCWSPSDHINGGAVAPEYVDSFRFPEKPDGVVTSADGTKTRASEDDYGTFYRQYGLPVTPREQELIKGSAPQETAH